MAWDNHGEKESGTPDCATAGGAVLGGIVGAAPFTVGSSASSSVVSSSISPLEWIQPSPLLVTVSFGSKSSKIEKIDVTPEDYFSPKTIYVYVGESVQSLCKLVKTTRGNTPVLGLQLSSVR